MSFLFANSGDASTPAPPTGRFTKALIQAQGRVETMEKELAALREKYRCKCAADEQYAIALTKAQTQIETLTHERDELRDKLKAYEQIQAALTEIGDGKGGAP